MNRSRLIKRAILRIVEIVAWGRRQGLATNSIGAKWVLVKWAADGVDGIYEIDGAVWQFPRFVREC